MAMAMTKTASGLQYEIIEAGTGPKPAATDQVKVHYRGTLLDGKEFDSSWKTGAQPLSLILGAGNVIKGWDEGLAGVKPGSRVQIDIPADKAYGDPAPDGYPSGALRFVVDVLSISEPNT